MRNPYRDIPRERARALFDRLHPYIDHGVVYPREADWFHHICGVLDAEVPRLSDRSGMLLYRSMHFDAEKIEQFRRDQRIVLEPRPYMSWSKTRKGVMAVKGLEFMADGLVGFTGSKTLVVFRRYFSVDDIIVDVDSLGRRAGYKTREFTWNGGEAEHIVKHSDALVFDPDDVEVYEWSKFRELGPDAEALTIEKFRELIKL